VGRAPCDHWSHCLAGSMGNAAAAIVWLSENREEAGYNDCILTACSGVCVGDVAGRAIHALSLVVGLGRGAAGKAGPLGASGSQNPCIVAPDLHNTAPFPKGNLAGRAAVHTGEDAIVIFFGVDEGVVHHAPTCGTLCSDRAGTQGQGRMLAYQAMVLSISGWTQSVLSAAENCLAMVVSNQS